MKHKTYILFISFIFFASALSQVQNDNVQIEVQGSVKSRDTYTAIAGVEVSTDRGAYTITNSLGEYKIRVVKGDVLIFRAPDLQTVRHQVTSDERVDVLVEGYVKSRISKLNKTTYKVFLDSAQYYKKTDIEKSIEFVIQAITTLGKGSNKSQLAESYKILGDIYQYHKQYDLAIDNFNYSLELKKTVETTLLLGETYVLNKNNEEAALVLSPLLEMRKLIPYQKVRLYELLGDAAKGKNQTQKAISNYNESLKVAEKNQIAPKITDLNSKIAEIYALVDRLQTAEGFYNNSLSLSEEQNPKRAIQEKEKVADFYNSKRRFDDEIQLRKKTLVVKKDATRKLSEVYRNQGDFTKALETYQAYVAVVDSLYVRKEQEISMAARLNREITTKQNRISSLEQDRELSQSKYSLARTEQQLFEESNKRQKGIIYSLVGAMALLALTAFFFYHSNKQQKLSNNLLALKSLRTQMNPHFIFNALNSVNHYIAKSDERSANRFLSDFSVLMRTVLENSFKKINEETIQISITDNGIGRKKSEALKTANQKKQRSKGMGNIKKRIGILNEMHKNKVDVTIKDLYNEGTGTKVALQLKKD